MIGTSKKLTADDVKYLDSLLHPLKHRDYAKLAK